MQNVEISVKGSILTITIDLSKQFGESSSGKSVIVASTQGNIDVPNYPGVKIGVNCYKTRNGR